MHLPGSLLRCAAIATIGLAGRQVSIAQSFSWAPTMLDAGASITSSAIKDNTILVGTDGAGVYRSTDRGESWTMANVGLSSTRISSIVASADGSFYAGTVGGGVGRSSDGSSWTMMNSGLDAINVEMLTTAGEGFLAAATEKGVYVSVPGANSWRPIGPAFTHVWAVGVNPQGVVVASTPLGATLRSTNGGQTWEPTSLDAKGLTVMAWHPAGIFFVGSSSLYASTNGGATWAPTSFSSPIITALAIRDNGDIFVGSDQGVSVSTDRGATWRALGEGQLELPVMTISFANDGTIYAGTFNGSLFRSSGSSAVTAAVTGPAVTLGRAYPNPARTVATIPFTLSHRSDVTITVTNMLGRVMKEMAPGTLDVGAHSVEIALDGFASGIYFYRLRAEDINEASMMIVAR